MNSWISSGGIAALTLLIPTFGGADLAEWLVRNGLTLDWPMFSKGKYNKAQREAEHAGRGMWVCSYVEPWLFRACMVTIRTMHSRIRAKREFGLC
jgi:hypothetical protein